MDSLSEERLFASFRIRRQPRQYFKKGRVIHVLWPEPAGGGSDVTSVHSVVGKFGERIFHKTRRFVVIREGDTYCLGLPIMTYAGQGVAKANVNKSEHLVIHTGKQAPKPLDTELPRRGEVGLRVETIRVIADLRTEALSALSRLHLGKVSTIEHNVKVRNIGKVHEQSMQTLELAYSIVQEKQRASSPRLQLPSDS